MISSVVKLSLFDYNVPCNTSGSLGHNAHYEFLGEIVLAYQKLDKQGRGDQIKGFEHMERMSCFIGKCLV